MNDELRPQANADFTVEKFDDEILLYSEGVTQAVYLNDAAYAVWLLCKENMTIGQIITYLEEVYPAQKEQIRDDVVSALETLHKNGVVELTDDKSA